jgi:hypothetical protein
VPDASETTEITEADVTFNVVWTRGSFDYLQYFVASQIANSGARFRFVVNACAPAQVEEMRRAAARCPDRIVEVLVVSEELIGHGVALEIVRQRRDDGRVFAAIDPDIKANAPFVEDLLALLVGDVVAVSSATEVWSTTNVVPEGSWGVAGEHFYDRDGFTFGGPHLVLYRRDALDATCDRWGVTLGSAGPEIPVPTRARLEEFGRSFAVFDTGKIVNVLLQADGGHVVQHELEQLVHIGGMSHYFEPSGQVVADDGTTRPGWARHENVRDRFVVTRYTAELLDALRTGAEPPVAPDGLAPPLQAKMERVHAEVVDLMEAHRGWQSDRA